MNQDLGSIRQQLAALPDWQIHHESQDPLQQETVAQLQRIFRFPDFKTALAFTNTLATAAENANHHPAILLEWGRVTVRWWTHSKHGLTPKDVAMAAETDRFFRDLYKEKRNPHPTLRVDLSQRER